MKANYKYQFINQTPDISFKIWTKLEAQLRSQLEGLINVKRFLYKSFYRNQHPDYVIFAELFNTNIMITVISEMIRKELSIEDFSKKSGVDKGRLAKSLDNNGDFSLTKKDIQRIIEFTGVIE